LKMWGKFISLAKETQSKFEESLDTLAQSTQKLVEEAKEGGVTGLVEKAKGFVEKQKQEVFGDLKKIDLKRRQRENLQRSICEAKPPWIVRPKEGMDSNVEEDLKCRILKLTKDETNFIAKAPDSSVFAFDMKVAVPYATKALEHDSDLRQLRFKLVPKKVKETEFWRNYFYRVSLLREQLSVEPLHLSTKIELIGNTLSNGENVIGADKSAESPEVTHSSNDISRTFDQVQDFDHPDVNNLSDDIKEKLRQELKLSSPNAKENDLQELNMENIDEMLEGVPAAESDGDDDVDVDVDAMLEAEVGSNGCVDDESKKVKNEE